MIELSITVKDEERTLTKKEVVYDVVILSQANEELLHKVQAVIDEFGSEPNQEAPDVKIKAKMVWQ